MELIFRELFFEHNPREIGFAFHRAGAEIGQKDHLWKDTELKDVDTFYRAGYPDVVANAHFMTVE